MGGRLRLGEGVGALEGELKFSCSIPEHVSQAASRLESFRGTSPVYSQASRLRSSPPPCLFRSPGFGEHTMCRRRGFITKHAEKRSLCSQEHALSVSLCRGSRDLAHDAVPMVLLPIFCR